jgi:SAM-dependent methyltransferase
MALQWLKNYAAKQRVLGIDRCNDLVGAATVTLKPTSLLDVGCGDGSMMAKYFGTLPPDCHGIEGAPMEMERARQRGIKVVSCDLNGRWPFQENQFDAVLSSQVIEHVHNTRLFAEEIFRVLKPGGTAVVASENLCSLLNWLALTLGYTPFSLMQVCGRYLGNPFGLHYGEPHEESLPIEHPAFSGVCGHIRVLTVRQARELFEWAGFEVLEARSVSILPLPDSLSKVLEGVITQRGHYLFMQVRKPVK